MNNKNPKLTGKIIMEGQLKLISPLVIGSGDKDNADTVVIKDCEGKPYIPATSFTGAIRHYFENYADYNDDKTQWNYFWGSQEDNGAQSALICSDLNCTNDAGIVVRDGVRIDNKKGIAEAAAKFDYEVVEPGAEFKLKMEITLRAEYDQDFFKKTIIFIRQALLQEEIRFGAMTMKGFGKCKLESPELYEYDFSKDDDVKKWLSRSPGNKIVEVEPFNSKQKTFRIEADFDIKTSMIIKSAARDCEEDDAHIQSAGKFVLPGTSVKGAVRARAIRIINTLGGNGEEKIKDLFGCIPDPKEPKDNDKTAIKSRVRVEETFIEDTAEYRHNRIKIDRFTGGASDGALFNELPLWKGNCKLIMVIEDYSAAEAGLLLLILKDLWSGDLPIGGDKNIGRGVLKGKKAVITYKEEEIVLGANAETDKSGRKKLESLVTAFNKDIAAANGGKNYE